MEVHHRRATAASAQLFIKDGNLKSLSRSLSQSWSKFDYDYDYDIDIEKIISYHPHSGCFDERSPRDPGAAPSALFWGHRPNPALTRGATLVPALRAWS
jgi:hypothetical protein